MAELSANAHWKPWPAHSWPHTLSNEDRGGGAAGPAGSISSKEVQAALSNANGQVSAGVMANSIVAAAKEIALSVPLVVRLEGTNVEKGKEILAKSGLPITSADNLADAAQKIVKAVKGK